MSLLKSVVFGATYIANRRFLNKHTPLIAGLTLTNKCNLRCRQCKIPYREVDDLTFEKTTAILDSFYREGGRTIYFQGGEPFLWSDRHHTLEDLVRYAQQGSSAL
jgi:MoaA/NifB/PqqE/SkfB family radical SAM enzyme